jgi:chromosome segregation ATPase
MGRSARKFGSWIVITLVVIIGVHLLPYLEEWVIPVPPPTSSQVEQLVAATGMTPKAQRLFYRQTPTIEQQASFKSRCKVPDKGIMLGCYSSRNGQGKIVIQSVEDNRLQGVMEVTAAHEMLHAAYQQLTSAKKDWLEPRLRKAAKLVTDQRLKKILQQYEQGSDEALYLNELHSHLGTEVADLQDAELEDYYQQYFQDRSQVTALAQRSVSALKQLDSKAETLKPQIESQEANLKQLKQDLDEAEDDLQASAQNLDALGADLDHTKALAEQALQQGQNNTGLVSQFEQQKANFNQLVEQHNQQVRIQKERVIAFNEKVDAYKQDVKAYNQIANEERSLMDSISGKPGNVPEKLDTPGELKPTRSL